MKSVTSFSRSCLLLGLILAIPIHFSDILWAQPRPPLTPEEVIGVANYYDINYRKTAQLYAIQLGVEAEIKRDPFLRNDIKAADAYRSGKLKDFRTLLDGTSYRNGYIESLGKDSIDALDRLLSARSGGKLNLPKNTVTQIYQGFLDRLGTPGQKPNIAPGDYLVAFSQMLKDAQNPRAPGHRTAKELVEKIGLDPTVPWSFSKENQSYNQNREILNRLVDLNRSGARILHKVNDVEKEKKELNAKFDQLSVEMKKYLAELAQALSDTDKSNSTAAAWNKRASLAKDMSQGLGAASTLASLLGDNRSAESFARGSAFLSALANIAELQEKYSSFSMAPGTFANAYIAAIAMGLEFMETRKRTTQAEVQAEMFQNLFKCLETMRQEMHVRFNQLEATTERSFNWTLDATQSLDVQIKGVRFTLDALGREILAGQNRILGGIQDQWSQKLLEIQSQCLRVDTNGKPVPRSQEVVAHCRDQFARMALSHWQGDDVLPQSTISLNNTATQEFSLFRDQLVALDATSQITKVSVNPGTWLLGASQLLKLFEMYPQYSDLARSSLIVGRDDLSLQHLIQAGQSISDGLEGIALIAKSDGSLFLKKDLMDKLISKYRAESIAAIRYGKDFAIRMSKGGPRPFVGLADQIDVNFPYEFLNKPIPFCANKKLIYHYDPARFADGSPYFLYLEPPMMALDVTVLGHIPLPILWASRMGASNLGFEHFSVTPCFRRIEVTNKGYVPAPPNLQYLFEFDLDFVIRIAGRGYTGATDFVGARLQHVRTESIAGGHPHKAQPHSLLTNVWYGQTMTPRGGTFSWSSVRGHFHEKLTAIKHGNEPEVSDFGQRFEEKLRSNSDEAIKALPEALPGIPALSAKRMIELAVGLGIHSVKSGDQELTAWVSDPDTLFEPRELAYSAVKRGLAEQLMINYVNERLTALIGIIEQMSSTTLRSRADDVRAMVATLTKLLHAPRRRNDRVMNTSPN